jgi:hypothetical protein
MTTRHHHGASRFSFDEFPGGNWIRRNKLTAGIVTGAVALIVVAVIVIASSTGSAAVHPVKAPPKAPATSGSRWVDGSATTNLNAVNAGVIALTNAAAKRNVSAATAAGTQLANAATTALHGAMPPVDAGVYRAALAALVRAGHVAAAGKLATAMPLVNDGIAGLIKVTASVNAPKPR